ncbi:MULTISPECIES: o-succinylbenzoate synthase [Bacillus]|nr:MULTISPECIES: o-succinylbenzoate synthase [Bacillus]MED1097893.1 o-succinylbenzoate synthase [Bacillus capparidis]
MQIRTFTLYHVTMKLKSPFTSSLETLTDRKFIILEAEDESGKKGWGEVSAFSSPWYTEETLETCYHMLKDFFIPELMDGQVHHPTEVPKLLEKYRGNRMAKAGVEAAFWDLYSKQEGRTLSSCIGGVRTQIPAGVAVGMNRMDTMLSEIHDHLQAGYKRIKIKIKPGHDIEPLKIIRAHFPGLSIMADANSSYQLKDISGIKALDQFDLMMIEQPLAYDDIVDHRHLQKHIKTPICLDESILSADDARKAIELGSCKVINIKPARVGGLTEALKIHKVCKENNIPVWCGGMVETGISRAQNIALASLSQFTIPGDISSSSRFWENDIIEPNITVENGYIQVPQSPGIGFDIDQSRLSNCTSKIDVFTKQRMRK